MIYVLGGGGSGGGSGGNAGLNFKVVGSTTEPTNPSENTIWVNTAVDKDKVSTITDITQLSLYIDSSTGVIKEPSSATTYTKYFPCESGKQYRFRLTDASVVLIASFMETPAKGVTGTILYGAGKTNGEATLDYTVTAPNRASYLGIWFYQNNVNSSVPELTINDMTYQNSLPDEVSVTGWYFSADDPFIGDIIENAGEYLGSTSGSTSVSIGTYSYRKAYSGKAVKIQCRMEIDGTEKYGFMLLSSERDACAVIKYESINGTTETREATDSIVHNGKTYYYISGFNDAGVTVENDVLEEVFVPYNSYEELAIALVPTYNGEGAVWFKTGTYANVSFNAVKKNCLQVYPTDCYQYVGGVWLTNTVKIWQDNAWKEWAILLYEDGNEYMEITGGWSGFTGFTSSASYSKGTYTEDANSIYMKVSAGTYSISAAPENAIDLTNVSRIEVNVTELTSGAKFSGLVVSETRDANFGVTPAASLAIESTGLHSIDVSSLSGSYYVGVLLRNNNSVSSAKSMRFDFVRCVL